MTDLSDIRKSQAGLSAKNLTQGYGDIKVLHDIRLDLPANKFTAILGPNGCGKSTLLKSLAGLLPSRAGAITLDGDPIDGMGKKALAREISTLAQGAVIPDGLRLRDLVVQGRYPHRKLFSNWSSNDEAAVDRALMLTETADLADRLLHELSGGQRQRGWIAMTLAQEGRILLLDEPTTFLDPAHQLDVLQLVRQLIETGNTTVVAVLHDLNHAAQFADHIVFLKEGKIVAEGHPDQVIEPKILSQVFGIDVAILSHPQTGAPVCVPLTQKNNGSPHSETKA